MQLTDGRKIGKESQSTERLLNFKELNIRGAKSIYLYIVHLSK